VHYALLIGSLSVAGLNAVFLYPAVRALVPR
jgi:hypothetical protein